MLPDPFTVEGGDVILLVRPNDTFRVHKIVLSLASSVFKDLFHHARPDQQDSGQEGPLPAIPITDSPESVDLILRFIYPGVVPPTITDLTVLSALLTIADKYGVQTIHPIVRERLAGEVLNKDVFSVYILARRWGFADEAKGAARRLTFTKVNGSSSPKDLQGITGEDFYRLQWFMQKRREEAKKVIQAHMVSWRDEVEVVACDEHSGGAALRFYGALAEVIVGKFDADPRLDAGKLAMALQDAPDPPHTGFCKDIDSRPEQEDVILYCPLRPSTIVGFFGGLAWRLESICKQYLSRAFDGDLPT